MMERLNFDSPAALSQRDAREARLSVLALLIPAPVRHGSPFGGSLFAVLRAVPLLRTSLRLTRQKSNT